MRRMGLTGGIASGKSTVAAMLRELGFPVLDADAVAHKLIEPGHPAHDEVLRQFGADLANSAGWIDRARLASIVFADPAKLAQLNAILHPRVEVIMIRQFEDWQRAGICDAVFIEAALLIEAGFTGYLEGLVVAWCRPEQQLVRLLARGMSELDARQRLAAQLPMEEKLARATETIDCSGPIETTRAQVKVLAAKLRRSPQ